MKRKRIGRKFVALFVCALLVFAFAPAAFAEGGAPVIDPSATPSPEPSVEPTPEPSVEPTPTPSVEPTPEPSVTPTPAPSEEPTPAPSVEPSPEPSAEPQALTREQAAARDSGGMRIMADGEWDSGWDRWSQYYQRWSMYDAKYITVELMDLMIGPDANAYAASENMFNKVPADDEMWVVMEFDLKYESGTGTLSTAEVFDYSSSFYDWNGEYPLTVLDTLTFSNTNAHYQYIQPGQSARVFCGMMIKKYQGLPTYHIPYYSDYYETLSHWYYMDYEWDIPVVNGGVVPSEYEVSGNTFGVTAVDVTDDTGVMDVSFAVWSQADQSDLQWYQGYDQGNGNWSANVNIANHGYRTGVYTVHAYVMDYSGNEGVGGGTTVRVQMPPVEYDAPTAAGFSVSEDPWVSSMQGIHAMGVTDESGVEGVRAAVWSAANGGADMRWYFLSPIGSSNWGTNIPASDFTAEGTYYVHFYGTDVQGNDGYLGATSFTAGRRGGEAGEPGEPGETDIPVAQLVYAVTDSAHASQGTLVAHNVTDASGVADVRFAVWSAANGQDDLVWYTANNSTSPQHWLARIDAANHNDEAGLYIVHAYATDARGNFGMIGYTTLTFDHKDSQAPTADNFSTSQAPWTSPVLGVHAENVTDDVSGVAGVRVAIWSDENGQDDLRWYNLSPIGGTNWGVAVSMKDFAADGVYYMHFYGTDKAGNDGFLGHTEVTAVREKDSPVAQAVYAVRDGESSTEGTIVAHNVTDASGVENVRFAVWSAENGQDDLVWYMANNNVAPEHWLARINTANHNNEHGTYIIHAYATDELGNDGMIGFTTIEF